MIELYKIFVGKYDNNTTEWITGKCIEKQYDTRNHRFALQQSHIHYDMCKFNFSNRIIPIWNRLTDYVVASPTINTFKARLDKFWRTKMFDTIGKPTHRLPEVVVKLSKQLINLF